MNIFVNQIFGLLNSPQGSLAYHLALTFTTAAVLLVGLSSLRAARGNSFGRLVLGLSLLMLLQTIHFLLGGLAWFNILDGHVILPIADRAVGILSLVLIIWLWAFPDRIQLADTVCLGVAGAAAGFTAFSILTWSATDAGQAFNGSQLELAWTIIGIVVCAAGILLLLWLRPEGWGMGLAMVDLLVIGYIYQLLSLQLGVEYSAPLRLAFICAFPILPTILRRLPRPIPSAPKAPPDPAFVGALDRRKQPSAESKTVSAWLRVALHKDTPSLTAEIARAIAITMRADTCYILSTPTAEGLIHLRAGYDLTRDIALPAAQIEYSLIPRTARFLTKGEAILMSPNNPEHQALVEIIGIDPCDMLLIPLSSSRQVWGAALLQAPLSGREWDMDDEDYLSPVGELLTNLLEHAHGREKSIRPEPQPMSEFTTAIPSLRQSLSAISGISRLLISGSTGMISSRQKTNLEKILASVSALQGVVEDVASGKTLSATQAPPPGDLASAFDEAVANNHGLIRKKGLTLQIDLGEDLPHLHVNQDILIQMLSCVLENTASQVAENGVISLSTFQGTNEPQTANLVIQVTGTANHIQAETLAGRASVPASAPGPIRADYAPARLLAEAYNGSLSVEQPTDGVWLSTLSLPVN